MVNHVRLKIVYVTLYPEKYPRVRKIAAALKDEEVAFLALTPRIRVKLGSRKIERIISAVVTYASYLLQIFFTRAGVYWVANSPDIFVIPLILKKSDYILDYRAPWPLQVRLDLGKGLLSRVAECIAWVTLKYAAIVTITTSALFKDVAKSAKKVYVIPNFPQKEKFKPSVSRAEFRRLHSVKNDEKVILFTGRLSKVEGVDKLPSVVEKLLSKNKKIWLWIVGDGVLRSLVEDLERKHPENVRFFGWRSYNEIPNFVNAADACIVPFPETAFSYCYNEEGVQKISEYMFFNKPIVACGVAPSSQYLLVKTQEIAEGILQALEGKTPLPTRKTWEDDCEGKVLEVIEHLKKL